MVEKSPPAVDRAVALDVQELDDGLLQLLLPNIRSMFHYMRFFSGDDDRDKLINSTAIYILKAIMIYATQLSSPAMRHLNVKVCEQNHRHDSSATTGGTFNRSGGYPSRRSVRNVIGITCLLPFLHELLHYRYRILYDKLGSEDDLDGSNDDEQLLRLKRGHKRQAVILHVILRATSIIVPSIQLYHYLSYLLNPRGKRIRTPSYALNANNLSYEYRDSKDGIVERKVNLMYTYRRTWYKELMILMSSLPVDVWRSFPKTMKLWYRHSLAQIRARIPDKLRKPLGQDLPSCNEKVTIDNVAEHSCSICNLRPVVIPYITSCGHLCCYTCLKFELLNSGFNYKCLVCGAKVESSRSLVHG